jgi:hypothetical protein
VKKFIFITLGYSVVTMLIAAPWHLIWFKDLYHSFGIYNRVEPLIPLGFLSMVIQGAIIAYMYPRFYRGGSHYKEAIRFSLLFGIFLFSISTLANAAKIEVSPMGTWLVVQSAFHLIQFVACGVIVGFISSRS